MVPAHPVGATHQLSAVHQSSIASQRSPYSQCCPSIQSKAHGFLEFLGSSTTFPLMDFLKWLASTGTAKNKRTFLFSQVFVSLGLCVDSIVQHMAAGEHTSASDLVELHPRSAIGVNDTVALYYQAWTEHARVHGQQHCSAAMDKSTVQSTHEMLLHFATPCNRSWFAVPQDRGWYRCWTRTVSGPKPR